MYRIIILLGVILMLAVITAGSLTRVMGTELLFGVIYPQEVHIYAAYTLAIPVFGALLFSWRQTHCRFAAIMASLGLVALLLLAVVAGIKLQSSGQTLLITGHLLLGMAILWLLFWLYLRANPALSILEKKTSPVLFARFLMVLLFLQIVLGSWVSNHQAALACSGFPQCNGEWWPDADYRGLIDSFTANTGEATFPAQVAFNWLHRLGALVCFILMNWLMLVATSAKHSKALRKAGLWLSFLLFVQVALGVVGYKFFMPMWVVVAHTVFAALLMLPLIAISFYGRYGVAEELVPVAETRPKKIAEPVFIPTAIEPEPVSEGYEEPYVEPAPESLYLRLKSQLARTRTGLGGLLGALQIGQKAINEDLLEEIEASLLMADVGIDVTTKIINRLTQNLERHQLKDSDTLTLALKQELLGILAPCSQPLKIPAQDKPFVILIVGVNGVGKTTTIGKLAKRLRAQGNSVMLAAGDTFRAAAVEQLQTWGQRNGIHVVAQHTGADSASVIYDGIQSAQSKGVDVLIADTAGRLHTKSNLMEELKKVKRIMAKLDETAPHEVILVLDAGTGQNALSQAKLFNEAIGLTGLVLTKLDGTAKGGVIFALAKQTGIPIRFIGVGEGIDDLQDFNAENFVEALFVKD